MIATVISISILLCGAVLFALCGKAANGGWPDGLLAKLMLVPILVAWPTSLPVIIIYLWHNGEL